MKVHPRDASRHPLKGAMPAARRSRFCGILGGDMDHACRAARDPLKGAALADRRSRFCGALGWGISLDRCNVSCEEVLS